VSVNHYIIGRLLEWEVGSWGVWCLYSAWLV